MDYILGRNALIRMWQRPGNAWMICTKNSSRSGGIELSTTCSNRKCPSPWQDFEMRGSFNVPFNKALHDTMKDQNSSKFVVNNVMDH